MYKNWASDNNGGSITTIQGQESPMVLARGLSQFSSIGDNADAQSFKSRSDEKTWHWKKIAMLILLTPLPHHKNPDR